MKNNIKQIIIDSLISIGIACTLFCLIGMVFDQIGHGMFSLDGYRFTKMVLGCIGIGLGFGVPTIVYQDQRLSRATQMTIHLGIGLVVYTAIAMSLGWMGDPGHPLSFFAIFAGQIALALGIFLIFRHYNLKEAKKINEQLQKRDSR